MSVPIGIQPQTFEVCSSYKGCFTPTEPQRPQHRSTTIFTILAMQYITKIINIEVDLEIMKLFFLSREWDMA